MTDVTTPSAAPPGALPGDELRYNHLSEKMTASPWDTWARMRTTCPVAHTPAHGGHYVLTRYADVTTALVDPATFSSDGDGDGVAIPPQATRPLYPIDADPPIQRDYRSIINPHLSPRRVATMEPWVREYAREVVAALPADGIIDAAAEFTLVFPRLVAFTILDLPADQHRHISENVEIASIDRTEKGAAAGAAIFTAISETLERRRAEPPRDDLVGSLLAGTAEGGRPLTEQEVMSMMLLLLFGGLETTSAAIGGMLLWTADHPEDRVQLMGADDSLWKTATDEVVRWTAPVSHLARTVTSDIEINGCPIDKGSRVLLSYGSANRDTAEFARADEVVIDRFPNRHVGFGMGPHRCVGSHLAKLQIRVGFQEFVTRYPEYSVPDHSGIRWRPGETRYICNLPLAVGAEVPA
jgi:cytochrome P450